MKKQILFTVIPSLFLTLVLFSNPVHFLSADPLPRGSDSPDTPSTGGAKVRVTGVAVPESTDEEFVADSGGYLDQYLFRYDVPDGRLTFNIDIDRYYSDQMIFDQDGFLVNLQQLVDKGILPETATLRLRVWDVDHNSTYDANGDGIPDPEVDHIYVNDNLVVDSQSQPKRLTSGNEAWSIWSAEIPIAWLKFPQTEGSSTQRPTPASNEIAIDIDVTEVWQYVYPNGWAVQVDWGSLHIETELRPTVLVHGFTGGRDSWENWYTYPNGQPGDYMYDAWVPTEVVQLDPVGSINGNADMLAGDIVAFKNKYGVDRIYIVGHSKGGLDSRAYIRDHDDVEILVQLGTPNGGAFLADVALGVRSGLGVIPNEIISLLVDPALTQISTPYISLFNIFTGKNYNTKYVVYAGNHDPVGWVDGAWYLPGEDDTIVRVSSAHALSWFDSQEKFTRNEPNEDATHGGLTHSYELFQGVLNQLRNVDTPGAGATQIQKQQAEEPLDTTATRIGTIYAGQTVTETIVVDQADEMALQVMWGVGDVDVVVYTPGGVRVDPTVAASHSDIEYMDSRDVTGFANATYAFQGPESGTWTVQISAIDVGSGKGYFVTAFVEGDVIDLTADTDQSYYTTGNSILISAQLAENGLAATGATLTAHIQKPDGTLEELALYDDGAHSDGSANDGTYAAVFTGATLEGYYDILVTASGTTASSGEFTRSTAFVIPVAEGASALNTGHSDYALDEDGDGLYNTLYVNVSLDIAQSGIYRVTGILVDGQDHEIQSSTTSGSLSVGAQSLTLAFDGNLIFDNGVNGPYYLKELYLGEDGGALLPLDSQAVAHTTSAYDFASFQRPTIALTDSHSDWPEDVDGDGAYDYLNVDLQVAVTQAGYYDLNAQLIDGNGDTIVWAVLFDEYLSGVGSVRLRFPGQAIGEHGVDGPYVVRDLSISKTDGSGSEVFGIVHTTQPYTASDFRKQAVYLPLIFRSYSTTPNTIYGTVTDNGIPVVGTQLLLRYYNGSAYSDYATTTTDSRGKFQFANLPSLDADRRVYVRWHNNYSNPDWLSTWACWTITSSTTDPDAYRCDFDLDNVDLLTPSHGAIVSLPHTFTWRRRSITTDDYELNLADMSDYDPYWWTYPSLGYVGSYSLSSLPDGFAPGQQYGWWMWVYGPDGYGVSYYYRYVTFSNAGSSAVVQTVPMSDRIPEGSIEVIAPPQSR